MIAKASKMTEKIRDTQSEWREREAESKQQQTISVRSHCVIVFSS